MSINVRVYYTERPEEKFEVESSGERLKDFILNHERFEELSDEFKNKFNSIRADELEPYIGMNLVISGVGWHPYCAPWWDRWGGGPGEEAGYDDCELDEFHLDKDGELSIFDTFSNQNLKFTENDKSILLDMLVGENLIPTAKAPFTSVSIKKGGKYKLNVSESFKKDGFQEWVTEDDFERLDKDAPESDDDDYDDRDDDRSYDPYEPWS